MTEEEQRTAAQQAALQETVDRLLKKWGSIPKHRSGGRVPTNGGLAGRQPGGSLLDSLVLSRSPLTFWHKLLGRLPSSYRQLDAAVDALSERVLEGDAADIPPDVRQLTERVRWAVLTLR